MAKEGEKKNVFTNILVPIAASRMTETVLPPDVLEMANPENVVPLGIKINNIVMMIVAVLSHETCNVNGATYEVAGGFIARVRW